jgi:hypothetical protein
MRDLPFLRELTALLQETDKLLAEAEFDAEAVEGYSHRRQNVFAHLEAAGSLGSVDQSERVGLRELINAVLERDRLLMQKLEESLAVCREGLAAVPKARQALRGYLSPLPAQLVRRQA